jgi:short-subunit dehydrogenase
MRTKLLANKLNTILITGATGAIGSALALEYAHPGRTLILHGRNEQKLNELTNSCTKQGAIVRTKALDIRDRKALTDWLHTESEYQPIDLVIANAGVNINIGSNATGEDLTAAESLIETNLLATVATASAVLPAMRKHGTGQIGLVSSLAAYFGLPVTPSYCASKAGVKAYGEALRGWLMPDGIRVNVIMPGYVESEMCSAMPGPKPFLMKPEQAAKIIRRGLERDKARISFPFPLNLGTWYLSTLPASLAIRILQLLGYGR